MTPPDHPLTTAGLNGTDPTRIDGELIRELIRECLIHQPTIHQFINSFSILILIHHFRPCKSLEKKHLQEASRLFILFHPSSLITRDRGFLIPLLQSSISPDRAIITSTSVLPPRHGSSAAAARPSTQRKYLSVPLLSPPRRHRAAPLRETQERRTLHRLLDHLLGAWKSIRVSAGMRWP